ncbi:MAG: class A beta-lactamase-related serine hydrolase [Candidatus Pacebacteria bacterium]|nr:class A beta-lactamase-related serine hydrolase [Candidatus Paceibacterota bacterium]
MFKRENKVSSQKYIWLIVGFLFLGGLLGFGIGYCLKPKTEIVSTTSLREDTNQYKFIDPLLLVNRSDDNIPTPGYVALQKSIESYIVSQKKANVVTDTSVYFINYKKGGLFTIDPDNQYDPASMLKVVIMIGYLKESDTDPSILNQELTYFPSIAQNLESIPFEDPSKLVVGQTYLVSDLINQMIVNSDNGAMNLLLSHIDNSYLSEIYTEIGLKAPAPGAPYTISPADFSLFFRILYNGTYLSDASSEKALSILSQATFSDGLLAGLPAGTVVAHKFGERVIGSGDQITSVELHDCGIVYANQGPYLLCVMTRGKNLNSLAATIATISKMVYGYVPSS